MLLDAEGSKYFLFLDDGARFDGDEPPGCKVARPAFARFSRHLGLMGGRGVVLNRYAVGATQLPALRRRKSAGLQPNLAPIPS